MVPWASVKFNRSVDFTGSTAIAHELAVRGLVVLLVVPADSTWIERIGGGGELAPGCGAC